MRLGPTVLFYALLLSATHALRPLLGLRGAFPTQIRSVSRRGSPLTLGMGFRWPWSKNEETGTSALDDLREQIINRFSPESSGGDTMFWKPQKQLEFVDVPFPEDILDQTALRGQVLSRVFLASRDGWSVEAFHQSCDGKGPCVVVAETEDGHRFGGFSPEGCSSDGETVDSFKAFLFCWPDGWGGDDVRPWVCEKIGGASGAVLNDPDAGPSWGEDGALIIGPPDAFGSSSPAKQLKKAVSRLGGSFALPPAGGAEGNTCLGKARETTTLKEVEVFAAPMLFED